MDSSNSVITLTFGDSAENHAGMEKIGCLVPKGQGFSSDDLRKIQEYFMKDRIFPELYYLNTVDEGGEASVLVLQASHQVC